MADSPYRLSLRFRKILKEEQFSQSFGLNHLSLELRQSKSKHLAQEIERELYHCQIHQNEILRRQSNLAYWLEDLWLEEQATRIRTELAQLDHCPNKVKSPEDGLLKKRLDEALVKIDDERDQLLVDLDIERLREKEEDMELLIELHAKHKQWITMENDVIAPSTTYDSIAISDHSDSARPSLASFSVEKWIETARRKIGRIITAKFWNDLLERINRY